jgi:multicomponent Na+:H+ antiporter subunit C
MSLFPYVVAFSLFFIGLSGIVASRDYVHLIACLTVMQSSTYVLLLAIGYKTGGSAPIFVDHPPSAAVVDPVVQALVLTDIVVGAAVSALLLSLVVQLRKRRGTIEPDKLKPMGD